MLSEAEKLLITAGVCGRLAAGEKAHLRVLVDDNPAVKKLYVALCKDRDRVAALPKEPAPEAVWANVMGRVRSGPIVVAPKLDRSGGWLPYAVAASLLVAAAGGAYLLVNGPGGKPEVADKTPPKAVTLPNPAAVLPENVDQPREKAFVGPPMPDVAVASAPVPVEAAPVPRGKAEGTVFGGAVTDPTVFATVDARLPVLFPIADAADADVVRKIKDEFAAGNALRLDLFAKDTHRAADLFATAVRAGGTSLAVDGVTQEYLKRKLPLAWAVYSESLAGPDLLAILKRLAEADAKPGVTPVWTAGHLTTASTSDGRDAKDLFGVDPAAWKKKVNGAPTEAVSASTADAVAAALGKSTPGAAIMTTFLPANLRVPPALSPQIKKYHEDKPAKKDGAVPVVIVIRPGN